MKPLLRCDQCHVVFAEPDDVNDMTYCPGCGKHHPILDELTGSFEIAWFYEVIDHVYTRAEREVLRSLARRIM